jgi:hypothetical protein
MAEENRLRETLAEWHLDGPHAIWGGGPFGTALTYAVCLKCGAMVMLGDVEELVEGMHTERSVRIHTVWHRTPESPAQPSEDD